MCLFVEAVYYIGWLCHFFKIQHYTLKGTVILIMNVLPSLP
uniref:Uncharacterized protein n=1 Tax=Anguilla anguilla TaxID=7936 RepID=A0A0E9R712_ANGAN